MYFNLAWMANFHDIVGFFVCLFVLVLFNGFPFTTGIPNSVRSPCLLVGCSMKVCQYSEVVSHTSQTGEDL